MRVDTPCVPESEKTRQYRKTYRQRPEVKRRHAERARERYKNDPEYRSAMLLSSAAYRAKKVPPLRELVRQAKADGCVACGENDFRCLDFHHVDPTTKSFTIGVGVHQMKAKPIQVFKDEIAKCVVLCVNCHRKHHAGVLDPPLAGA